MSTYHAISSAAPALLVPLLALVIGLQGWQTASMVVGIVILTINIPIFFAITDRPEMLGFLPDGQVPDEPSKIREKATRSPDTDPRDFTLMQALKTSSFWLMLTGSCLRLTAKAGVILHIYSYFRLERNGSANSSRYFWIPIAFNGPPVRGIWLV